MLGEVEETLWGRVGVGLENLFTSPRVDDPTLTSRLTTIRRPLESFQVYRTFPQSGRQMGYQRIESEVGPSTLARE